MIGRIKDYAGWDFQNVAVGRINEVAALTGFSYKKMRGRFAREKYRRIPVISPGLIQFRKGFRVGL